MNRDEIRKKYKRWATQHRSSAVARDLDNAPILLMYTAKERAHTVTDVAVRAVALHTNRIHVFIFSVETTWSLDAEGEPCKALCTRYKLIFAF